MPYIEKSARPELDEWVDTFPKVTDWGELNYVITTLLLRTNPYRYYQYQAIIGLLECCKLEMYRKCVAIYENQKEEENGPVY